ncbi:chemotaxis protein CheA, partial [Eubacteriales bacterium OttesenSCG-928-N14]|nr:chemotaxis protein CheA [Eubacteriales bacterium OttesenSCG-928-N14]
PEIVNVFGAVPAEAPSAAAEQPAAPEPVEQAPAERAVPAQAPAESAPPAAKSAQAPPPKSAEKKSAPAAEGAKMQSYMNVNLTKLDKLMDLMGEIVITEATVVSHPDIEGIRSDAFDKAAQQLRKLTDELQDVVMSIRMVPISTTFHKMERIVRDISKKVNKQAELIIIGENTEVDKNIIDSLGDPLMHIVRNAMDHGIEMPDERIAAGKDPVGKVILEAKNMGSDVVITVTDDGKGLDKDRLVAIGIERGIIKKPANEVSDQEAYNLIYAAGFSTKEEVTEFSGRGVGMDVAVQNIAKVGGTISVKSTPGEGMTVTIRIPLTLAIIDGLQIQVGDTMFIVPILNTQESFKPEASDDIFTDPDGNEMIMIRGQAYPMVRMYDYFNIPSKTQVLEEGICIIVEAERQTYCLFADELVGEQQTVVKPLPTYIARNKNWAKCVAGCTIMGDGSINLIVDINSIVV